jgi:hypothetical protein
MCTPLGLSPSDSATGRGAPKAWHRRLDDDVVDGLAAPLLPDLATAPRSGRYSPIWPLLSDLAALADLAAPAQPAVQPASAASWRR